MSDTEDDGFLQRWSRRKQEARHDEPPAPDDGETDAAVPAAAHEEAGDRPTESPAAGGDDSGQAAEPEPPGDEDMPPLGTIDQGGGVEAFFSPNVSAGLRRAALKRLFSQPEFGSPDLLEEYAGDYSKPTPLGDIVTVEMRYRTEQARKLAERKLKAALESESETEPAPSESSAAASDAQAPAAPPDPTPEPQDVENEPEDRSGSPSADDPDHDPKTG